MSTLAALGISLERELYLTGQMQMNRSRGVAPLTGVSILSADEVRWIATREGWQSGSDLAKLEFTKALFHKADVRGVAMQCADLRGSVWQSCVAIEAEMQTSRLGYARLTNCDMTGAQLTGASLRNTWLVGNKWPAASLVSCDLRGAFINDDMCGADLSATLINKTTTLGSSWRYDLRTRLPSEPVVIYRVLRDAATSGEAWQVLAACGALEFATMDWRVWAQLLQDALGTEALRWAITMLYPWFEQPMRARLDIGNYVDLTTLHRTMKQMAYAL